MPNTGSCRIAFAGLLAGLALLCLAGWGAHPARAEQHRELIAVLDLDVAGTTPVQAGAVTDRLREVMLRSGAFTLVDRSQLEAVLNEQALQQTGCTSQECAVEVGRILGIRKIVAGKVTKLSEELWQLSTLMVDVETAETLRAETVIHEGNFVGLLRNGVMRMGERLSGKAVAPPPAAPEPAKTVLEVDTWSDAEVFLNGRRRGRGAQRFEELVPGAYEVEVRSEGARPWKQTVFLTPGQTVKLSPDIQRFRIAVLPIRRDGTWSQSIEATRRWVTSALTGAAVLAGFEVSHSEHAGYERLGEDLSDRSDLRENVWTFFGNLDESFVHAQGRALDADAVLAFRLETGGSSSGSWSAYLVDAATGAVMEESGSWPYGQRAGIVIKSGVQPMLERFLNTR